MSRPYRAGDRVVLRRRTGSRAGTVRGVSRPAHGGRVATVRWDDGHEQLQLTADLRREDIPAPRRKLWDESERQGLGRRYWFATPALAAAFAAARVLRGYQPVYGIGERTVWVALARGTTAETLAQLAGKDTTDGD